MRLKQGDIVVLTSTITEEGDWGYTDVVKKVNEKTIDIYNGVCIILEQNPKEYTLISRKQSDLILNKKIKLKGMKQSDF